MYKEKLENILLDVENKEVDIAGGAVVGMVLSITNSLIMYISNLTIGKKKYADVHVAVVNILENALKLKKTALDYIDKDKEILEEILDAYKLRKEEVENYNKVCIKAVDFCMEVLDISFKTLKLAEEISKVGNRMLSSDFKVCASYSFASIESAIVNVEINLNSIDNENYKNEIKNKCKNILEEATNVKNRIYE